MRDIIYGKDETTRVVCVEPESDSCMIFQELEDGTIKKTKLDNSLYVLYKREYFGGMKELKGDQTFKYVWQTKDGAKFRDVLKQNYKEGYKYHVIRDRKEAFMVRKGYTYFKDMKPQDVSVLSFDLEHSYGIGENLDKKGSLFIISNTIRKKNKIEKHIFALDEFSDDESDMLEAWVKWVREQDPSIMMGHNIFSHDLQILRFVSQKVNVPLKLGRDGSDIRFNEKNSQFRKDGSQQYDYINANVYGRELVDTYFLAMKYDIGRKYENYGLKQIVKQEGMEKKDRQHYDAANIRNDWKDIKKRDQIKRYAMDDAEDCIKLFDLMASSYFYYSQSIPRSFQQVINTASGSQLNSLMVRSYLQRGHSIAEGDEKGEYEGAISFAIPGIYKNVFKIDVASLYPSIMRQFKIYNKDKDPEAYLSKIVEYFTIERLKNKKLGKETGDRYYKDLEQAQKIVINSLYGFLGAPKLNYNYPEGAAAVTRNGREILTQAIRWSTSKKPVRIKAEKESDPDEWVLVVDEDLEANPMNRFDLSIVDTDSVAFSKKDRSKFTDEERLSLLKDINSMMPELIRWEDDDTFKKVIAVRSKNYVLQDMDGDIKIKGSGLKATMKEAALRRYTEEVIGHLIKDRKDLLYDHYITYVKQIGNIKAIKEWCSKKTYTKAVIDAGDTTQERIASSVKDEDMQEGDKFYVYFRTETELSLEKNFDGVYDKDKLLKKLHDTVSIFDTIMDVKIFPDFSLVRNKARLK